MFLKWHSHSSKQMVLEPRSHVAEINSSWLLYTQSISHVGVGELTIWLAYYNYSKPKNTFSYQLESFWFLLQSSQSWQEGSSCEIFS